MRLLSCGSDLREAFGWPRETKLKDSIMRPTPTHLADSNKKKSPKELSVL